MTFNDFNKLIRITRKKLLINSGILFFIIAIMFIYFYCEINDKNLIDNLNSFKIKMNIISVVSVTLFVIYVAIYVKNSFKCPKCNKMLEPKCYGIIIASKSCPKCGNIIINELPNQSLKGRM